MQAIVYTTYGSPNVLRLREIDRPVPGDDEVLLRVRACAINPLDWHFMTGTPWLVRMSGGLRKPKRNIPGVDVAGTVESVGRNVTSLQPGDEVFGAVDGGGLAEYVTARARALVPKPANVTFEQAAAIPIAGVTALQSLRANGRMEAGDKVLINGASGGVGTFAVQIAKAFGAEVTAVCSTRNVEQAGQLGADHVIDYTKKDFTRTAERYDVILDNVGNRPVLACRRLLKPDATYVAVSGPKGKLLGPFPKLVFTLAVSFIGRRRMTGMLAGMSQEALLALADLVEEGKVTPVIDRTYPLAEAADALRAQGEFHARGKIVVTVGEG